MNTLYLYGVADDGKAQVFIDEQGNARLLHDGSTNLNPFLQDLPGQCYLFCVAGAGRPQAYKLPFWPDVIVNEISDPDSHAAALSRAIELCQAQGNKPVINHPALIQQTRRDMIAARLSEIPQLIVPHTYRFFPETPGDVLEAIRREGFTYPLIFRQAGDHGGVSTTLINDEASVQRAMYSYALDGRPYYLTQFVDYREEDGRYRKYRIVVVGGQPFIRHQITSDQWLIHASSRDFMNQHPALRQEEEQTLCRFEDEILPGIRQGIDQITGVLKLDYYGIDCSLRQDGKMLVFEINANMNVLINKAEKPNIWERQIAMIIEQLKQHIISRAHNG
jgi:glutathione synthase/RimK-type ligase-like ATP-grasp enzyme